MIIPNVSGRIEPVRPDGVEENVILAPFTTMGVGGAARYFFRLKNEEDIASLLNWVRSLALPVMVMGEGSNMVISDWGFSGLVIKMEIPGIRLINEDRSSVEIDVGGGESWDTFVGYTVEQGWWGIENMSLIPGTVGALAVQNVGAYGQEASRVLAAVRAFDMREGRFVVLSRADCRFGFRSSIFNTTEVGRYLIVGARFVLQKNGRPNLTRKNVVRALRAKYGNSGWAGRLTWMRGSYREYSQKEIRETIITLRSYGGLLPEPNTVGNSGTFFRAALISHGEFKRILIKTFVHLGWAAALRVLACRWKLSSSSGIKVPTGMLIRACGMAGYSCGAISLLKSNCAVLINAVPGSKASDILNVIHAVRLAVYAKTGVEVPIEPNLVGFSVEEKRGAFRLNGDDVQNPGT